MSKLIVLNQDSKIKAIEIDLGTQYESARGYIRLHFTNIPESVKTNMDFLTHSIDSTLPGRVSCAEIPSSSEIPEGANLFEYAEAAVRQAAFVNFEEASQLAESIRNTLGVEVELHKTPSLEIEKRKTDLELGQTLTKKIGEVLAQGIASAVARSLGLPEKPLITECQRAVEATLTQSHLEQISSSETASSASVEAGQSQPYVATGLDIRSSKVFNRVIRLLNQQGFISNTETKALLDSPIVKEIREQFAFRRSLSRDLLPIQRQALYDFFEQYATPIIDRCAEFSTPSEVLGHVASFERLHEPIDRRDIAFAALVHCASYSDTTVLKEEFGGLSELNSPAEMLRKIYHGQTGMETLLKDAGIDVPGLTIQRMALFEFFEQKLNEKFGPENTSAVPSEFSVALVREVRKLLFMDNYRLNMIEEKDYSQIPLVETTNEYGGLSYEYAFKPPISINTFSGTIHALQGKFSPYGWLPMGSSHFIVGDAATERLASIRAKAEASLARSAASSSSSSSSHHLL